KTALLRDAAERFFAGAPASDRARFEQFCDTSASWLEDFALFMALKEAHQGVAWSRWEPGARARDPKSLSKWRDRLAGEIRMHRYLQFAFFEQWKTLRQYCRELGIRNMGDLPIYVAHDSADVWVHPEYFQLEPDGEPTVV